MNIGADPIIIDEVPCIDLDVFYCNLKRKLYGFLEETVMDASRIYIFLLCLKKFHGPTLPPEMILEIAKHVQVRAYRCRKCGCKIIVGDEFSVHFEGAICSNTCAIK